jgi:hypothetical protein
MVLHRGNIMNCKRIERTKTGAYVAAVLTTAAMLAAHPASAAVTTVESSSTVLDVAVKAFGTPLDIGPLLPVSGSAPAAYDLTNSLASFSKTIGPLSASAGVLVDTASGDTAAATGAASSSLASLDIALKVAGVVVASLDASAVSSMSSVDGTPSATGSSSLADLTLTVLGSSISIPVDPPPNDVIFDSSGLIITLNQQIHEVGGNGVTEGITTNAIAINFDRFLGNVTGRIDIAQSMASVTVTPVPEPSTWVMIGAGFAGLALVSWRARKRTAIA